MLLIVSDDHEKKTKGWIKENKQNVGFAKSKLRINKRARFMFLAKCWKQR